MPRLAGRFAVVLTVTQLEASAAWYERVLAFTRSGTYAKEIVLRHESGLTISLVAHEVTLGELFDERRTGLDHLEMIVDSRADLDDWASELDRAGVEHSGVKSPY